MQIVKTVQNFIILCDALSSMDKKYKNTDMRKVNAEKKMVMEMNSNISNLNYMAGLYTYAGGKGGDFLTAYYPMKRYNKGEFGQAIDRLPNETGGLTLMQNAFRE